MKVAHLILAHKNPAQLLRLITALQHPAFNFYIHVDARRDIVAFRQIIDEPNVFFVNNRASIHWGDWGTIQATLNGFQEILGKDYEYINVISGQDFPIKSPGYILQYLSSRKGEEFITCEDINGEWNVASRVKRYHLINWRAPGRFKLGKIADKILPPRKFPLDYQLVGRSNWFTITSGAARYVVEFLAKQPRVVRFFKYCWGADEFIFSTILYNSSFKNKIRNNLLYVEWSEVDIGHPRLIISDDFEKLKSSDKLFARKFDQEGDSEILAILEDLIKEL